MKRITCTWQWKAERDGKLKKTQASAHLRKLPVVKRGQRRCQHVQQQQWQLQSVCLALLLSAWLELSLLAIQKHFACPVHMAGTENSVAPAAGSSTRSRSSSSRLSRFSLASSSSVWFCAGFVGLLSGLSYLSETKV